MTPQAERSNKDDLFNAALAEADEAPREAITKKAEEPAAEDAAESAAEEKSDEKAEA